MRLIVTAAVVLRDHKGTFISGVVMIFEGIVPVFEAEAIGVDETLS